MKIGTMGISLAATLAAIIQKNQLAAFGWGMAAWHCGIRILEEEW
jgi:hypothetical protein